MGTHHALLKLVNSISQTQGNKALSIFLDIRKAFDCVNHEILLTKLHHYGIRGKLNDLIRSFFTNRKQKNCVNGKYCSTPKDIELGVLQESILGVLLADDNSEFLEAKDIEKLIEKSNIELNDWYFANKLAIHSLKLKSRSMIFYHIVDH